jgi:hypothetical protein
VETQPPAGFGFSLIYCHFTYIICLASKYAPMAPANHHPTSYAHLCEPVWPSGQILCFLVLAFNLHNFHRTHSACETHRHHGFTRNLSRAYFYDLRLPSSSVWCSLCTFIIHTHTHLFSPSHTHLHSHTQSSVLWLPYWEISTVPVISGIEHVKHRVSCGHIHKAKQRTRARLFWPEVRTDIIKS